MAIPFIILCHGRCGSTFLQYELNAHPSIKCFGEMYHPSLAKQFGGNGNQYYRIRDINPQVFLQNSFDMYLKRKKFQAIGGKILYPEITLSGLEKLIKWEDLHVIFLYRKNILETATSMILAEKVGYHIEKDQTSPIPQPFIMNIAMLRKYIKDIVIFHKTCRGNIMGRIFSVCYEELINVNKINEILQFLRINSPITELHANTGKQMTEIVYNSIINRGEIEGLFGKEYGYLNGRTDEIGFWKQLERK